VVTLVGSVAVRLLANRTRLIPDLSAALTCCSFTPRYDRGRVLVDVPTVLSCGGEARSFADAVRCPQNHVDLREASYSAPKASLRTPSSRRARITWTGIRMAQMTSACQPCRARRTSRKAVVPKT
jgi:hypothetical protein